MKLYFFLFLAVVKTSITFCQPTQISLVEGGFKNALSWYIEKYTDEVNSILSKEKPISLNQVGVVMIDFFNLEDSIENKPADSLGIEKIRHPLNQFQIQLSPRFYVTKFPPSFYLT
jgi:hypothetical protein